MVNIKTSKSIAQTKNMHTEQGKGTWRRTPQVSEKTFADNWARTFGGGLKGRTTRNKAR